jgi:hypothetical protein
MDVNRPGDDRHETRVIAAQAIIALSHDAPATLRVSKAIMQLERILPPPGTPEYRAAYEEAHAR